MFEVFYKNCRILSFLHIVLTFGFLHAQKQNAIPDIEKIYLHTDRSTYYMGEDLWYKAYEINAYNNLLFNNSKILYVELISSDSKLIIRNKTNLEFGLGRGDFKLIDSLNVKPGVYQLRAYTNWCRNFGDDFVFTKNIKIIDLFKNHSKISDEQKNVAPNKTPKIKESKTKLTIDFFPEGGSLLENVASVLGFKAVDSNGNPIDVKGEIYDSDNELVASFQSVHDGIGKLAMFPLQGKKYYAKIKTPSNDEFRAELPAVLKQGYLLGFKTVKGKHIVSINTNVATLVQNPNPTLSLVCKAKGIPYFETGQSLTETTFSFELQMGNAPEGISQITLYDSNAKPQSERLVYIEKDHDLEVQLAPDKASYVPNEKATINVASKSKSGAAKSASFSLSVTDMNGAEDDKDYGTNICSYFLMESDIRGKVYNPAYYFDTANAKRLEHLDNLLLTQGWRDFLWKTTPKANDATSYKAEQGITISGKVKQIFGSKPLVNNSLTLALFGKKSRDIFSGTIDPNGRFQFENLIFTGTTNMYLNTSNAKGKFRGELVLDPIEQNPIPVSFKNEAVCLLDETNPVAENVFQKYTDFGIKLENLLNEVVIKGRNKYYLPVKYRNPFSTYTPDVVTKTLTSIWDVFETIPSIWVVDRNERRLKVLGEDKGPFLLVNGDDISRYELDEILPNEIVKIEVLKGSLFWPGGIISIYLNRYWHDRPKKMPFSIIKKEIEGYYAARVFYSPDPEKPNEEFDKMAMVRNTIYWNPYVHPDKTGNINVSYYNSNVETKVKVALEGITATGIPVVKNVYYTIKK